MASNSNEEPKTGPQSNRWYDLTLGPSFRDHSANKYCTLRYDFKPASIDKAKAGALKKTKDNRVTVEFQNNQVGKPKVTFKGSSEEYKGNDAVLFFDGQTFRLERLHRSVKQLRYDRQPGESAAGMAVDPQLSPVGKAPKLTHQLNPARTAFPVVPVDVERIDVGVPENPGAKAANKGVMDYSSDQPNVSAASPGPKNEEVNDEHQDIDIEDLFGSLSPDDGNAAEDEANPGFDINMPHQNDSDNEIADVDDSGDEVDKKAEAELAAAKKASTKKKESGKSSVLLDDKPWDDETDMKKLEEAVRSVEMEGLFWGTSKLVSVGYGIKKLQIMLTIVDDLVSVDDLIEEQLTVEPRNEYIQSCDIVAFNKI